MNISPGRKILITAMTTSLLLAPAAPAAEKQAREYFVYVGTYTGGRGRVSEGIYVFRFDTTTGKASAPSLAATTVNPSFLAVHPGGKYLYAANEVSEFAGKGVGAVGAFAIDRENGKLTLLNQASSAGSGPAHLTVDRTGKCVLVANYGGGSVAALPIKADGSLGEPASFIQHTGSSVDPNRQKEPHAHSINVSPDNRFAFAADLGLDKILIYKLDPTTAALTANDPPFATVSPGSGPRHFAFHPSGKFAYVINEMLCTMTAFSYDAKRGELKAIQTVSTLPAGESVKPGYSTAEVVAHPNGKFLYGSNRGHDTIAVYAIGADGKIMLIQNAPAEVKIPRNFNLDPTGRWLITAGQNSDNLAVFRVDQQTGRLEFTGTKIEVGAPVCVRFLPIK